MRRAKVIHLIRRAMGGLGVAGLVLVGLELVAQLLHAQAPGWFEVATWQAEMGPERGLEPDPVLLWRSRPGTRSEAGVTLSINAAGLRGAELDALPVGDRVLFLGDSSVYGWGVERSGAFAWGATSGTDLVTVNAATPGYSSSQARFQLEQLGPQVRPAVVVIGTLWSDLMRTGWRDAQLFERLASAEQARALRAHERLERAALFRLLRAVILGQRALPADHRILWDTILEGAPGTELTRNSAATHRANLEDMVAQARRLGAAPVFVVLPVNRSVSHPDAEVLDPYLQNFHAVAAAAGAPVVDVAAAWAELPMAALPDRFLDPVHPSAVGHADIAERLRPVLQAAADRPR